ITLLGVNPVLNLPRNFDLNEGIGTHLSLLFGRILNKIFYNWILELLIQSASYLQLHCLNLPFAICLHSGNLSFRLYLSLSMNRIFKIRDTSKSKKYRHWNQGREWYSDNAESVFKKLAVNFCLSAKVIFVGCTFL